MALQSATVVQDLGLNASVSLLLLPPSPLPPSPSRARDRLYNVMAEQTHGVDCGDRMFLLRMHDDRATYELIQCADLRTEARAVLASESARLHAAAAVDVVTDEQKVEMARSVGEAIVVSSDDRQRPTLDGEIKNSVARFPSYSGGGDSLDAATPHRLARLDYVGCCSQCGGSEGHCRECGVCYCEDCTPHGCKGDVSSVAVSSVVPTHASDTRAAGRRDSSRQRAYGISIRQAARQLTRNARGRRRRTQ